MIERSITPTFLALVEDMPVVALLGSRQVGKTTLVKELTNQFVKKTIYLDLESSEDFNRLQDAELYLSERADHLIIIDEVQRMSSLFPLIRSLVDRRREAGRFILLGSASPALLQASAETLAGRISYLEMQPLHWGEVAHETTYSQHWLRGGYPEMLLAASDKSFQRRMYDFIRTYIEHDLPLMGLAASTQVIRNLFTMLSSIHGNLLNVSELSRGLGMSVPTIQHYLDFLESAFIIRRIQPYFVNIGKRIIKAPKLYFRDSGMLHALANIGDLETLSGHLLVGASWEGYIIQQIIAQLPFGAEAYFYRTADGTELDLVLVQGGKPVLGVEVKYSNSPKLTRGSRIAMQDLGNIPLLVITPSATDFNLATDIQVCSIATMQEHVEKYVS
jgi:predicted AAA+ superfamily ATPase